MKATNTVSLEMTGEEASVLFLVVGNVSGASDGPRGIVSRLYDELADIGIQRPTDVFLDGEIILKAMDTEDD